ncbi:MAG TPA: hypothetical protein VK927_03940, partial [Adhaeribacter sp.]|nr:hypothetical protein [Adhaeribacter sp.]
MAKLKTSYFCQNCGAQSAKWLGRCPACGEWNTYVEEVIQREEPGGVPTWKTASTTTRQVASKPKPLAEISFQAEPRIITSDQELNRVLGGGIV